MNICKKTFAGNLNRITDRIFALRYLKKITLKNLVIREVLILIMKSKGLFNDLWPISNSRPDKFKIRRHENPPIS